MCRTEFGHGAMQCIIVRQVQEIAMCWHRRINVVLLSLLMLLVGADAKDPPTFSATLRPLQNVYLARAPIWVFFGLKNESGTPSPLRLHEAGMPVVIQMLTPDGKNVEMVPRSRSGGAAFDPGAPVPDSDIYTMAPGEEVEFKYNLTQTSYISQPGQYTLQLQHGGRILADARVVIGTSTIVQEQQFSVPATCRLYVADLKSESITERCLALDSLDGPGIRVPQDAAYAIRVPGNARLTDTRMDYLGQVWAVIQSGDKSGLVVWDLANREFRTLLPLGDGKIGMGTTRAPNSVAGRDAVIAGRAGQTKFTSLSIGSGGGDTGFATEPSK
jgi:hypothetical protein